MAIRGRKPNLTNLRLVTGGPGTVGAGAAAPSTDDENFDNGFLPPKKLKKRQQELWDTYIRKAPWLTKFDLPTAFMWVELTAEFELNPAKMQASKIAQIRSLGSELCMDPASRARLGNAGGAGKTKKDPAEQYFD